MSINKQILKGSQKFFSTILLIVGFKENQTQVKKLSTMPKYEAIDVSYFVKLLCESSDLCYVC